MAYYDIKLSYPNILMAYAVNKMLDPVISMTISNRNRYCDIILPYPTGLVIYWHIVTVSAVIAETHLLLPHFKTPTSYVHNVIITPYIDIIILFFA